MESFETTGFRPMIAGDRYWDSSTFLTLMNKEPGFDRCRDVLKLAEQGDLMIVTSAITLTEVVKYRGSPRLDKRRQAMIRSFFDQPYIEVRDADRYIAEAARNLMWTYEHLDTMDAIHLATATAMGVRLVESADDDFLRLHGKIGSPPIDIFEPGKGTQADLL